MGKGDEERADLFADWCLAVVIARFSGHGCAGGVVRDVVRTVQPPCVRAS